MLVISCVTSDVNYEVFFFILLVTSVLCLKVFIWGNKLVKTKMLNWQHLGSERSIKHDT